MFDWILNTSLNRMINFHSLVILHVQMPVQMYVRISLSQKNFFDHFYFFCLNLESYYTSKFQKQI